MTRASLFLAGAVAALLVAPLAFLTGLSAWTHDGLDGIGAKEGPFLLRPNPRQVVDRQPVNVVFSWEPGPVLRAPAWAGIVTSIATRPGTALRSGDPVLAVDGVTRIAWASPSPFYRRLEAGDRGADVVELHRLLEALRFLDDPPDDAGFLSWESSIAIQAFNESLGGGGRVFDPATVIWLPADPYELHALEASVAAPAPAAGSILATSAASPIAATIQPRDPQTPLDVEPGVTYSLTVGPHAVSVTGTGTITPTALTVLASSVDPLTERVAGWIERAEPLNVLTVPATAIMAGARGGLCAWVALGNGSGYRAAPVVVVGSELGVTSVSDGLSAADQVLANPAAILEDPSCPSP
jgi:hypothetical protein